MVKPTIKVTGSNFQLFTRSSTICILKADVGDTYEFGELAKSYFKSGDHGNVNFGHVSIKKLSYRSRGIQDFLKIEMPKIGLHTPTILPGYYLFKDGELKAYHPGTFEPSKVDATIQGFATLAGALAGVIVGIAKKSAAKGFEVFLEAMEMPVTFRVTEFFNEMLGANSSSYSQQRQQYVYDEEILKAYKLLEVSPNATDAEVAKARKKLVREHHPDKHPNEVDAKNKYCAELNNAYDLIKKYRASNN